MLQIRKPKLDDFETLYHMARCFYMEGAYRDFTFCQESCIQTMNAVCSGALEGAIVDFHGIPVGFAAWSYERHCTVEPIGMAFLFYVSNAARGTAAARVLRDNMDERAKKAGCAAFYIASTAGFNDDGLNQKLFTNLFRKKGFEVVGSFMRKVYAQ